MLRSARIAVRVILGASLFVTAASAATIGQIDDFQDGTTQGWLTGLLGAPHPFPPVNDDGGPNGAGDRYMRLTSIGGGGPGSRMAVINVGQWTGDFTGIGSIEMDVWNIGTTDLSLRLLLGAGGPPTDLAVSSTPVLLAAGSGWTHVSFSIRASDLTVLLGSVDNVLQNAFELRIFHSTTATFPGEVIASELGVDNIEAVAAIPEPSSLLLLGTALLGLAGWRRLR